VRLGLAVVLATLAAALLFSSGPTAAWRHSPIGSGLQVLAGLSANKIQGWIQGQRRVVRWEQEGIESSVAIRVADSGPILFLNGKSEGSAVGDASTQIMSGMIGAILHPEPRNALIIGLGTAPRLVGWLQSGRCSASMWWNWRPQWSRRQISSIQSTKRLPSIPRCARSSAMGAS
jgi:hypothetical protein